MKYEKSKIRIESSTIGKAIDMNQSDPNHMGACMAPAAVDVIYNNLMDLEREI